MQTFVPLAYDILTILLFVYMIAVCARRGFARTIVSFLGYGAALVGATAAAKPLAGLAYGALIRPALVRSISEKLAGVQAELLPENLLEIVEALPSALVSALGVEKGELVATLHGLIQNGGADVAASIADAVVQPLAVMLLKMVFFLLVFSIAMFFVRKLVWVFRGVNRLPLIGPANRILGGAVGVAQAVVTMYVLAVLLTLITSFVPGGITIHLSGEAVTLASGAVFQRTILFKAFVNSNPLDLFLAAQIPSVDEVLGGIKLPF